MCGNSKHDEHGNHIDEVEPVAVPDESLNVTREFETTTTPVEVPAEVPA